MNPMEMMKLAGEFRKFQGNHPKMVQFMRLMTQNGIPEGSVLELTITKPGEQPVTANMRVNAEDLEMFENLKKMKQ